MSDYKDSRWASEIIDLQKDDGSWGFFHSLSNPSRENRWTTEKALRRLEILGYTVHDRPIARAVSYMHDCLTGKKSIPDRREKLHNWDIFTALILSTWIRRFTKEDDAAHTVGKKWAEIITRAFECGAYDHDRYVRVYKEVHELPPRGGRLLDIVNFYHVSLMSDLLDYRTASALVEYVLQFQTGIYYIYETRLSELPQEFKSKAACRYLSAIELLAEYENPGCREKLGFVAEWLRNNREPEGYWDMGTGVKDGVQFPLSDSWRKKESRVKDCTYRITKLIGKIEAQRDD